MTKFRIISLPPFKAVSSGVDPDMDFSPNGILGRFSDYFSTIRPIPRDDFRPRDFLFYDKKQGGLVWWWAISEGMDNGGYEEVDFDGGYYLTYVYKDGDHKTNGILYEEALDYIKNSDILELDERENHYSMGHIITPAAIIEAQGFAQMESFIPIRIKTR